MNKGIKLIEWTFVLAMFVFAFEPMAGENEQLGTLLTVVPCILLVLASIGSVILLIKDWRYFMNEISKNNIITALDIIVGLFGLTISYIYKSDMVDYWIAFLVLEVPYHLYSKSEKKEA